MTETLTDRIGKEIERLIHRREAFEITKQDQFADLVSEHIRSLNSLLDELAAEEAQGTQFAPVDGETPAEWRYLISGKGGWRHCWLQSEVDKLLEENRHLPEKRRHVIEPLFLRSQKP